VARYAMPDAEHRFSLEQLRGVTIALTLVVCPQAAALLEAYAHQAVRPAVLAELERQGWARDSGAAVRLCGLRAQQSTLRRFVQPVSKRPPYQATIWRRLAPQARALRMLAWRLTCAWADRDGHGLVSMGARARVAQLAPRLAHVGLCSPRYTSFEARLALVKHLGADVGASLAALYQPLLGMTAAVAFTGATWGAAYLLVILGLFEQVATERHRISSLAQTAADRNSWREFPEAALAGARGANAPLG
jgi:hypothetical protein